MSLSALLERLSSAKPGVESWKGWQIQPISGGSNGLLYRATGADGDYAIKFTARDQRNRARREYQALSVLDRSGLAPDAVLLDETHYAQPVVVQGWLVGEVDESPPDSDAAWQALIDYYAALHRQTAQSTGADLPEAVHTCKSAAEAVLAVRWQMLRVPEPPAALHALADRLDRMDFPEWSPPQAALCRTDPNTLNFIRRPQGWASVDWENSGWGDPAFEIADMMIHPAYIPVSPERWDWVIEHYAHQSEDPQVSLRIGVYYRILALWWVARLARYLYEIPRGLDQRLVERPPDWQVQSQRKYDHYLALAASLIDD